ncbi:MAG: hypothetical protein K2W96_11415 [Gemmataceae bacterium]|nr:hypothetical protein [Gemmataceae bacterium]
MQPYHVYIAEPPTLLDDLLEASLRLFHNRCAVIQRVFHAQWLKALGQRLEQERAIHPNGCPEMLEARAREWLSLCRALLREKQAEMLQGQADERKRRDEAIRAYVEQRERCAA